MATPATHPVSARLDRERSAALGAEVRAPEV